MLVMMIPLDDFATLIVHELGNSLSVTKSIHTATSRYGQELLTRGQAETEGFKIDTTGKLNN